MFNHIVKEMEHARTQEKNAEFTYGVHAPSLLTLVPDNQATILSQEEVEKIIYELDKTVMGSVRSLNERFALLRQAIMYSFIWRLHPQHGVQFFVYRRTKRNNEGQLSQRLSLGAGGHFESPDLVYYTNKDFKTTQIISLWETCNNNYYRERGEEVDGDSFDDYPYGVPALHGFVMDSQPTPGYVGNIHFGVLAGVRVINPDVELTMKEPQNDAEGWFTPAELMAIASGETKIVHEGDSVNFEPWSLLMIQEIEKLTATLDLAA